LLIYQHYRQNGIWPQEVSGYDPSSIAEMIAPYEPARNVTPDYPPTLLIHGTHDTDVPFEQSTIMAEQFKKNAIPFYLIPIDNGEHGFIDGDRQQIKNAYAFMREFIVKHLSTE
jgi:dipeptidyl aminopeptidase/acylaminoacyl peptidase